MKKNITKIQEYTLKHTTYEDGTSTLHRHNDGFNVFELIGMLTVIRRDLMKQIEGISEGPTHVIKTAVEPQLTDVNDEIAGD